jgi:hypothetical protein
MNIFQKDKEHFKTQYEQQLSIDAGSSNFSSAAAPTIQRTVSQICKPTITTASTHVSCKVSVNFVRFSTKMERADKFD